MNEKHAIENALIILNYNDATTTISLIEYIKKYNAIKKIIVVDNCSTDNSYMRLKILENDNIDVIRTDYNGGYAVGNNFGCRYAIRMYNPNFLIIANPDTRFQNEVIVAINEALRRDNIGVIAPIVNQGYNVWDIPDYKGVLRSIFLIWFNIHKKNVKRKLLNSSQSIVLVGVVEGSFWAIKSEVYEKIGGLDEGTFLYYEENLLAQRLARNGYGVGVLTKHRYDHFHSVSIKKEYGSKAKAFRNFKKGMLLYMEKYLEIGGLRKCIFNFSYNVGYIERIVYDCIKKIIG